MELPKEFKGTIYFYWNVKYDFLFLNDSDREADSEYILIGTHDVDVSFDVSREQAVGQVVSNLRDEKKRLQAKTQMQLNEIDERINNLLAITHQAES